jgi:hypothetical protein
LSFFGWEVERWEITYHANTWQKRERGKLWKKIFETHEAMFLLLILLQFAFHIH